MSHGPGKYDAECTAVQQSTDAEVCLLIVCGGNRGSGFSATFKISEPSRLPALMATVPKILRDVADQIEADNKGMGPS